jgi:hypothetical protein
MTHIEKTAGRWKLPSEETAPRAPAQPARPARRPPRKPKRRRLLRYGLLFGLPLTVLGVVLFGLLWMPCACDMDAKIVEADQMVLANEVDMAVEKLKALRSEDADVLTAEQMESIARRIDALEQWQQLEASWDVAKSEPERTALLLDIQDLRIKVPEYGQFFQKKLGQTRSTSKKPASGLQASVPPR